MYALLFRFRGVFPKLDELIAATGASPSAATGASPAAATGASPAAAPDASAATTGARLRGFNNLIGRLADLNPDVPTRMNFGGIDVVDRLRFLQTCLYKSFNEHTCIKMLKLAQDALRAGTLFDDQAGTTPMHVGGRPIQFQYQEILYNALEIAPVSIKIRQRLELALHYFDPDRAPCELLTDFCSNDDAVSAFLRDLLPMKQSPWQP